MTVLGLGHDVVEVSGFAAQLAEPGTRMRALFSARESRQAALRGRLKGDGEAVHLAARWAGKEAVLKAWCEALSRGGRPGPGTGRVAGAGAVAGAGHASAMVAGAGHASAAVAGAAPAALPYTLDDFPWPLVEILDDARGVPHVVLAADVEGRLASSLGPACGAAAEGVSAAVAGADRADGNAGAAPWLTWHVSLSHDGPVASAVVLLELRRP